PGQAGVVGAAGCQEAIADGADTEPARQVERNPLDRIAHIGFAGAGVADGATPDGLDVLENGPEVWGGAAGCRPDVGEELGGQALRDQADVVAELVEVLAVPVGGAEEVDVLERALVADELVARARPGQERPDLRLPLGGGELEKIDLPQRGVGVGPNT